MGNGSRRKLRAVSESPDEAPFAFEGRPKNARRPISWKKLMIRLLALAWGVTIVAALVDAFGAVPHLPFITAMGMTALVVAASFLWTRDEPEEEGPRRRQAGEDE